MVLISCSLAASRNGFCCDWKHGLHLLLLYCFHHLRDSKCAFFWGFFSAAALTSTYWWLANYLLWTNGSKLQSNPGFSSERCGRRLLCQLYLHVNMPGNVRDQRRRSFLQPVFPVHVHRRKNLFFKCQSLFLSQGWAFFYICVWGVCTNSCPRNNKRKKKAFKFTKAKSLLWTTLEGLTSSVSAGVPPPPASFFSQCVTASWKNLPQWAWVGTFMQFRLH